MFIRHAQSACSRGPSESRHFKQRHRAAQKAQQLPRPPHRPGSANARTPQFLDDDLALQSGTDPSLPDDNGWLSGCSTASGSSLGQCRVGAREQRLRVNSVQLFRTRSCSPICPGSASLANVLVYPLDLVTARIQTKTPQSSKTSTISNGKQPNVDGKPSSSSATSSARSKDAYADLPTALTTIYHASGGSIAGFYQGIASDTLSTALSNFLYFYIFAAAHNLWNRYKTHRAQVQHHGGGKGAKTVAGLAAVENLVVGALAGILSRGVTTPLSTITVRKQTSAKSKTRHDEDLERKAEAAEDESEEESDYNQDSSMSIARDIYQEHGLAGFWRGYSSACALVSLSAPERLKRTWARASEAPFFLGMRH